MSELDDLEPKALPEAMAEARILVVDDNPANLAVLAELLAEAGFRSVDVESSPEKAVERWLAHPYDLLLLDMRMPGLDGLQVMDRLRTQIADGDYLPCIVLTAQTDPETRAAALDAGALDFILKPFDLDEALKRIRNALQTRLLHRQARQRLDAYGQTISAQQQALAAREHDIAYLASHDSITGLLNRHGLCRGLESLTREGHKALVFLLIELSDADQLILLEGTQSVDYLLREAGTRLASLVGERGGLCGVWRGQTFLAVFPQTADLELEVDRIFDTIFAPLPFHGSHVVLHGRGGYALVTDEGSGIDIQQSNAALRAAGLALASAHRLSNRALLYDARMAERFARRHRIERAMQEALQTQAEQFQLAYQPKVDIHGHRVVGCEALLRWHHPTLGTIGPAEFIPIAEDTGAIEILGLLVMDRVFAFLSRRLQHGPWTLPIAINVSARQFELMRARGMSLVNAIETRRAHYRIPRGLIELEITESSLLTDFDWLVTQLEQLRDNAIGVALDDFGTGYSSLSYLRNLPINTLKIDRSFVDGAARDSRQAFLLSNILHLARDLKFVSVAEGVETLGDLDLLRDLSCAIAQGYYFSRPLSEPDLLAWLAAFPPKS
ncbi:EAL domain-containing protein [Acidithiobacillus caldus]|uniref:Diguanylate cyclase n=1 Tax=Acidithiobacillus caldus TaxID=33059 RepID=A0A1E7YJF3_9PROT|nr:EAL domain-containing protein [Acidithiobacillus caldus]MBU2790791.1 EAL domain-containing protein [Acidithiobacillus caldus]MBU2820069.1 EAL domain-containing protein [Acidithiobacillus caldus]OFC29607.1 diguanylate cyclase [Acidithiobacillus caldus]OFC36079.1 diguanylate cyclase [Acidithiobacillus caldus]OFC39846.1 diguanylate cyclase [Acidithiobacillus caldus]